MEELQILASLIQHADKQIDVSMNMFLVVMGVMATFTMTQAYQKNFNVFLKVLLSVALTAVFWANRETITDQMHIYNALVANFPDDVEPWKTLFGDHGVYHMLSPFMMFWLHATMSSLVHVLVWHKELKDTLGRRAVIWWKNRKARQKRLTGK